MLQNQTVLFTEIIYVLRYVCQNAIWRCASMVQGLFLVHLYSVDLKPEEWETNENALFFMQIH